MTTAGLSGALLASPGDPAYAEATRVFNLSGPAEPAAATTARTVEQVQAVVGYAAAEGMRVRVHTTGHAAPTARPMRGAVLIRTLLDGGVEIDADRRVARAPAGTCWADIVRAAARHGLAAPHGSAGTVGVVGYLLRGGVSFYGRKVGLAANSVRAVELVTADGRARRVDAASDPELFRALRGGGGGFGVVTAVEVALFPAAKVFTGATFWPAAHASRLLSRWLGWTRDAPWEAATSLRVMNLPPHPEIPPALTAGPVLCVAGAVLAETEGDVPAARRHTEEMLGPLRAIAEPVMDTWRLTVPATVLETHMDPADPLPLLGDHMLVRDLGDEGAGVLLRQVGEGSGSPLAVAELRQLGGALAVPDPAGGLLSRLDAPYAYMAAGVPESPAHAEAITRRCADVRAALAPWDTGRTAPTFVENHEQPQGHLDPDGVRTADRVRARVDPDGMFRDDVTTNATAHAR